jgi:hypothetical protein
MLLNIIQTIDLVFTKMIFVPTIIILIKNFKSYKKWDKRALLLYRICIIYVIAFIIRYICQKFIFTPVNYPRFTESGLFPLIETLFY